MGKLSLLRSRAVGGGAKLILGTLGAQLLGILALPILARLYTPEDFGVLSLILAVAALVSPSITLRLESALMLPKRAEDAAAILYISVLSAILLSAVTGVVLQGVVSMQILGEAAEHAFFPLWAGVITFLYAAFTLVGQFALRERKYGAVASRSFYQAVVSNGVQLAGGVVGAGANGLLAGAVVGRAVGIVPLLVLSRGGLRRTTVAHAWSVLRRYKKFPLVFAPSGLLNAAGLQLPILIIGALYTSDVLGQAGMAERLLSIPLTLVAAAVGQVIEAEFSSGLRRGERAMRTGYLRVTALLSSVSVVLVLGTIFLAPWIVKVFLGTEWELTGRLLQIMVVAVAIRLIVSPTSKVFVLLERSALTMMLDVMRVVFVLLGAAVAILLDGGVIELILWAYGGLALTYVVTWVIGLRLVSEHDQSGKQEAAGQEQLNANNQRGSDGT